MSLKRSFSVQHSMGIRSEITGKEGVELPFNWSHLQIPADKEMRIWKCFSTRHSTVTGGRTMSSNMSVLGYVKQPQQGVITATVVVCCRKCNQEREAFHLPNQPPWPTDDGLILRSKGNGMQCWQEDWVDMNTRTQSEWLSLKTEPFLFWGQEVVITGQQIKVNADCVD